MVEFGTVVVGRRAFRLRRLGLAVLWALAVAVVAVLVPLVQEERWARECAGMGDRLEQAAADTDPLLTAGSRLVYTCYSPDGQALRTWSW